MLTSSTELRPFRVEQDKGTWFIATPEGKRMWSLGMCCTGPGIGWEDYDPGNPGYSGFKLHPNGKDWVGRTLDGLRQWGFNSLGGWSETELIRKYGGDKCLPYFVVLHLGAYNRAPWDDMFDPRFDKAVDGAARDQINKIKEDPYLIGYFTDNELGWWDDTLIKSYLMFPETAPGKQKLIALLKQTYRNQFDLLLKDWITPATSFDILSRKDATMLIRPGGNAAKAINAWTSTLAKHYYKSVHDAVRRYDTKRPIFGDRYMQFWEESIVKAAIPYVDAISTNYGAEFLDGSLTHFFLGSLHKLTHKPIIITEFYWNAMENRSGNMNSVKAFPIVQTQRERADGYKRNVIELASRPYVIGAHWFQYYDEPPKGRHDGEDGNMGFVDTLGRPYELLVEATQSLNFDSLRKNATEPKSAGVVPVAPADPMKDLLYWPRDKGWVPSKEDFAFSDLYVCSDAQSLYVAIYSMDYIDESLYEGGVIPQSERPHWTLDFGNKKKIDVRYMGKQKATVTPTNVQLAEVPGLKHIVMLRIPWAWIGGRPSDRLKFESVLDQHSRSGRMSWSASLEMVR